MRPTVRFLSQQLIEQILSEARDILCKLGLTVEDSEALSLLADHGAEVDTASHKARFTPDLIDNALKTVPKSFQLYDVQGQQTHDFAGMNIHFTPASSALNLLDHVSGEMRKPLTPDFVRYIKVLSLLPHINAQSTAFIPVDVKETIADSYRLYLALLYGTKPVVTGTFNDGALAIMKELQVAVRGSEEELKAKPMSLFSCCPNTPLKWSSHTCRDILDCARAGIPTEIVSMPLAGFTGPVTLAGSLTGHTAENLSGMVLNQLAAPGAPLLYGGALAAFDVRYETTPMGAVETQMMVCGYNEIGKYLGVPTQGYIALSDAKFPDMQAGMETASGAFMAALAGINSISGPGMLDFINCFSLEKLVIDHETCATTRRMLQGIEPRDDFPIIPRYEELLKDQHLLISKHSRRNLRKEHYFPGTIIDRTNRGRWQEEGALTLKERAHREIDRLLSEYQPSPLPDDVKIRLTGIMEAEARRHGMDALPGHGE